MEQRKRDNSPGEAQDALGEPDDRAAIQGDVQSNQKNPTGDRNDSMNRENVPCRDKVLGGQMGEWDKLGDVVYFPSSPEFPIAARDYLVGL